MAHLTLKRRFLVLAVLLTASAGLAGCRPAPEVTSYTVKRSANSGQPDREVAASDRMIAEMNFHGDENWVVKLVGPIAEFTGREEELVGFFKMFAIAGEGDAAAPSWQLPPGWTEQRGPPPRYATISVGGAPNLDMSVSRLPLPREGRSEYALANINRWRGQMGRPPIGLDELDEIAPPFQHEGMTRRLIRVDGTYQPGSMRGPFGGGASVPRIREKPDAGGAAPVTFVAPEGWKPGRIDALRTAAFDITSGDKTGELTVLGLKSGAADLLANINIWRRSLKLDRIEPSQVDQFAEPIDVGGHPAHRVHLVSAESGDAPRRAVLAAIVPVGDRAWFVTFKGDAALVEEKKAEFQAFLDSVKFEAPGRSVP